MVDGMGVLESERREPSKFSLVTKGHTERVHMKKTVIEGSRTLTWTLSSF